MIRRSRGMEVPVQNGKTRRDIYEKEPEHRFLFSSDETVIPKALKYIFSRKPVINRMICSLTDHPAADTVKQFPASKAI